MAKLSLNKIQRLKSHKLIEHLFSRGKSFAAFPIKALYDFTELTPGINLQSGVAVSKKNFKKAVERNRIKRLLREAYRVQKPELQTVLERNNKQLVVFFIYTGKEMAELNDLQEKVNSILLHLKNISETGK